MLGRLANGLADDPLAALVLAREPHVPLLVAPAMNTQMWRAAPTQRNLAQLREDGAGTLLVYTVKASVGGKLAQVGSRLIESTTRKLAGNFFEKFSEVMETR